MCTYNIDVLLIGCQAQKDIVMSWTRQNDVKRRKELSGSGTLTWWNMDSMSAIRKWVRAKVYPLHKR